MGGCKNRKGYLGTNWTTILPSGEARQRGGEGREQRRNHNWDSLRSSSKTPSTPQVLIFSTPSLIFLSGYYFASRYTLINVSSLVTMPHPEKEHFDKTKGWERIQFMAATWNE